MIASHHLSIKAVTDYPVHELIASRWSPYSFANRSVSDDDLRSLFEAARWAPSSYNEQPWSYMVAKKEDADEFGRLLSCLVEANQVWAKAASVLALGISRLNFARNNNPNRAAIHDLGLAAANLVLEATSRGLAVHQMIGILPDKARELYSVPGGQRPDDRAGHRLRQRSDRSAGAVAPKRQRPATAQAVKRVHFWRQVGRCIGPPLKVTLLCLPVTLILNAFRMLPEFRRLPPDRADLLCW